jgi:type IV pilus assembly protein PilN
MTALLAPSPDNRLWSSMPGWGIVADLTPPELIARRHLRVLRKLIIAGLTLVVLLCAAGFAFAFQKDASAVDARNDVIARTNQLQRQLQSPAFRHVVEMKGTVAKVQAQVALLMKDDVDLPALLTKVRAALPASMAINNLTVTLNSAATAAAGSTGRGLDTSGHTVIGTVIIAGSSKTLDDLPAYIDRLAKVAGVVNLVPTSNLLSKDTAQFTLSFAVTDKLFSHRYDVKNVGGK